MLKKLSLLLLVCLPLLATHFSADAARLGGGRSMGRSYSAPASPPAVSRPSAAPNAQPTAPAAQPSSPWKGILGGALLGLGLGALFSSLGFGAGMSSILSMLLIGALVFMAIMLVMRLVARRKEAATPATAAPYHYTPPTADSAPHTAYQAPVAGASSTPEIGSGLAPAAPVSEWEIPADFDQAAFLRQAKTQFIRLQAAWDKADLNDLREFTTSAMFAEIKMDLQDRGSAINVTEVMTVDARLLGIKTTDLEYVASVQLTGTIKEAVNAPTSGFSEVWYLSKPKTGGGWLLAGIEQR